jgi:hypothetical protein
MNKKIYISDEQRLKQRLQQFQPEFDEQAWLLFQQQLPATPAALTDSLPTWDTTGQGAWSVLSNFFIISKLYQPMLIFLMTLTLSGQPGRISPTASTNTMAEMPAKWRTPKTVENPETTTSLKVSATAAASTNEPQKAIKQPLIQALSNGSFAATQPILPEKRTPDAAVQLPTDAATTSEAVKAPVTNATTNQPAFSENTPSAHAAPVQQNIVPENSPASAENTLASRLSPTLLSPKTPLLSTSFSVADSVKPVYLPYKNNGGRYIFGLSLLRGFPSGMLLRGDFIRMVNAQIGFGFAMASLNYDQTHHYSATSLTEYSIASTSADLTINYHWKPLRRVVLQTYAGAGIRGHTVAYSDIDATVSQIISTRYYSSGTKFGFDAGASLLFEINPRFQAGVRYLFNQDYIDDISHRNFVGLMVQMRL